MARVEGWMMGLALLAMAGCTDGFSTLPDAGNGGATPDAGGAPDAGQAGDGGTAGLADVKVTRTNLTSDGSVAGTRTDADLVNPWGIARSDSGPFWIADNGTGRTSILDANGNPALAAVTIPVPSTTGAVTTPAKPTGVVFNGGSGFSGDKFLFATEDGTIAGWSSGASAVTRVDNSGAGAVYKGITIVGTALYAANFHSGQIDAFGSGNNFTADTPLTDPSIPSGFGPFNVAQVNGKLYVAWAKQDAAKHDEVAGTGNGFLTVIDPTTKQSTRLVSNGVLNAPWAMVLAPSDFGAASGKLLVGNFGDGTIHVIDPTTGAQVGRLTDTNGNPIVIDGLWGLSFGNDGVAGPHNTLFFVAGPADEAHGVFGKLELQ